jgi:amidase
MHETAMLGASVGTRATERVPAADGVIMERLKARGAILLGKTNMVNALQTISEQFGRSSNPYDNARTTGGSSGGAAAAVAAGLSPFDVGTDLSGSIRMPAHFCGVFGLRPTPHRIPVSDLVTGPIGFPRLDRVLGSAGPIARTAADVALLFRVLAGPDPRDPEVPPVPVIDASRRAPGELRVAIMPSIGGIRIARDIQGALENLGRLLSDAGAHVEHREAVPFDELLPSFRRYLLAGLTLAIRAGIAPPGAKFLGGPEPTLYDVMVALDERDRFIARLDRFFADYDVLIGPAATVVAFPHCAPGSPIDVDGTSLPSICVDHPTILSTYTGSPSLVVPIARTEGGLPIGAQVIGRRWQDEHLVAIGAAIAEVAGPMPPPTVGGSSR